MHYKFWYIYYIFITSLNGHVEQMDVNTINALFFQLWNKTQIFMLMFCTLTQIMLFPSYKECQRCNEIRRQSIWDSEHSILLRCNLCGLLYYLQNLYPSSQPVLVFSLNSTFEPVDDKAPPPSKFYFKFTNAGRTAFVGDSWAAIRILT